MEELKQHLQNELEAFKKILPSIQDIESLKNSQKSFQEDIENKFSEIVTTADLIEIKKAIEIQGEALQSIKMQGEKAVVSFEENLKNNIEEISKSVEAGKTFSIKTTRKAVTAASFVDNTIAYRDSEVGQLYRGIPFIADLLPRVNIGAGSGGTVVWHEQESITDNAAAVNEGSKATESAATWVEKSLIGKRISANMKISKNQIKDISYLTGEISLMIQKSMKLAENNALLKGTGLTNNIKGLLAYATAFDKTGISIAEPNIADLISVCRTQILNGTKDAAYPNYSFLNPTDVDKIRFAKTDLGQYLFPNLIVGGTPNIASIRLIENSLIDSNTLLVGDFNMATLFVFDDLTIEIKETEDDAQKGLVTVIAYMRENLRVRTSDEAAFVKVANISQAIIDITKGA